MFQWKPTAVATPESPPPLHWLEKKRTELRAAIRAATARCEKADREFRAFHTEHAIRVVGKGIAYKVTSPAAWATLDAVRLSLMREQTAARAAHSALLSELAELPKEHPETRFVGGKRVSP